MLLVWLLAFAPPALPQGQADVVNYLRVADAYASANHAAAVSEIRRWAPSDIESAVASLERSEKHLCAVARSPGDIPFALVESAVLMHAEAGLLALQSGQMNEGEFHLRVSTNLLGWSRGPAARSRSYANQRAALDARHDRVAPRETLGERIPAAELHRVVAAAALALGFPETALPFAESARDERPADAEIQLVLGCAAESLAAIKVIRQRASEARPLRAEAEKALRSALAIDSGLHEARVHLGRLLVETDRLAEAEPVLDEVERLSVDGRHRYLARLLLGRIAEHRGRPDQAARLYARAVAAWPDSQAARVALAHVLESSQGSSAATALVLETLAASSRSDRAADPWWLYRFGPPGVAKQAMDWLWKEVLDR